MKKMVFKALVFYGLLKNQKNLERSDFLVFYGFFRYCCFFCINYAHKLYSYSFFIIIWFSIYMNLYFTVFTLHSLCQYIVLFLSYFWLSRLKPKKNKKPQKTIKNQKTKFLILKNHWFFSTPGRPTRGISIPPLFELRGTIPPSLFRTKRWRICYHLLSTEAICRN